MQQKHDPWWFVADFAYFLVNGALKVLGFNTVIAGAYWAFMTFGGVGLAVVVVFVAAWRLTKDIARIEADTKPDRSGNRDPGNKK